MHVGEEWVAVSPCAAALRSSARISLMHAHLAKTGSGTSSSVLLPLHTSRAAASVHGGREGLRELPAGTHSGTQTGSGWHSSGGVLPSGALLAEGGAVRVRAVGHCVEVVAWLHVVHGCGRRMAPEGPRHKGPASFLYRRPLLAAASGRASSRRHEGARRTVARRLVRCVGQKRDDGR